MSHPSKRIEKRAHPVPCVNATHFEAEQGKHLTWEGDRICPRCIRISEMFAMRQELNAEFDEDMVSE